jgi:hypothetical protein
MNSRNIFYFILAVGAITVVGFFLLRDRDAIERTPYHSILILRKLPYNSGIQLRGEAQVNGSAEFKRGMVAYDHDQFSDAIPELARAVKLQPDSAAWKLYLGICYYMTKQSGKAVEILSSANQLADIQTKPHTRWYLALARLMDGQRDPAVELLNKLVQEKTTYTDEARDLLLKLRNLAAADSFRPTILSPQQGQRFISGRPMPVQWSGGPQSANVRFRIMLSLDGGVTFTSPLVQGIPFEQTAWTWNTAEVLGEHLKIRVDAVTPDSTTLGTPSAEFALIVPPLLTLANPNNGQPLRAGLTYPISWRAIGPRPESFNLLLVKFNGESYAQELTIAYAVEPDESTLIWSVAAPAGDHFRLRLDAQFSDTTISILSERDFSLKSEVILDLHVPENATASDNHIAWTLTGQLPTYYSVELCDSTGTSIRMLAARLAATDTHYVAPQAHELGTLLKILAHYPEGTLTAFSSEPVGTPIVTNASATPANPTADVAQSITLSQNFPNPFNNSTTIQFTIRESAHVKVMVFNLNGQLVSTPLSQPLAAGTHDIPFKAENLASGTYIYRVEANGQFKQNQMTLAK